MTDEECLDILLDIFRWPDTPTERYHALLILYGAWGRQPPTPDDYFAGTTR